MLAKLAPCEASAVSILANTRPHCASKSAGALPSLPAPTWPAMKTNSDALTRVSCEYCPSGLPSVSGFWILMSATSFHLHAARLDRRFPLGDFALDEIAQPFRALLILLGDGGAKP